MHKLRNIVSIIFLLMGVLGLSSCHAASKTVAERCVLIDLYGAQGRKLLPLLERFAQASRLESELSHPINPKFHRVRDEKIEASVSYIIGVGEFGAVLALFRYEPEADLDLVEAFDLFVKNEISTAYRVTKCADVPNFKLPESYK